MGVDNLESKTGQEPLLVFHHQNNAVLGTLLTGLQQGLDLITRRLNEIIPVIQNLVTYEVGFYLLNRRVLRFAQVQNVVVLVRLTQNRVSCGVIPVGGLSVVKIPDDDADELLVYGHVVVLLQ